MHSDGVKNLVQEGMRVDGFCLSVKIMCTGTDNSSVSDLRRARMARQFWRSSVSLAPHLRKRWCCFWQRKRRKKAMSRWDALDDEERSSVAPWENSAGRKGAVYTPRLLHMPDENYFGDAG